MKHILLAASILFACANITSAQSDTTYQYLSKYGIETAKDSASHLLKLYRQDNLWYGKAYDIKTGMLKWEGSYAEKNASKPTGSFKNYNDKGVLDNLAEWDNGKLLERTYFYKNGSKRSWISHREKPTQQKGWDEAGKEIKNYVVEREARFKGGAEGWKRFLERNLNASVAADAGAPVGNYPVKVQFVVSKEGYVSNVRAVSVPRECRPCGAEVVRVIVNGPEWEPAIQNNEPVIYQAIQHVTFQVAEEGRKGKKG
jgi:hypothetical protein